jgi:hypothetical protein
LKAHQGFRVYQAHQAGFLQHSWITWFVTVLWHPNGMCLVQSRSWDWLVCTMI